MAVSVAKGPDMLERVCSEESSNMSQGDENRVIGIIVHKVKEIILFNLYII